VPSQLAELRPPRLPTSCPWHQVRRHEFENLIALCPNCHTRFDHCEIDRKSMFLYKGQLKALNERFHSSSPQQTLPLDVGLDAQEETNLAEIASLIERVAWGYGIQK
jgi:HNH endonuclease